MKTSVFIFIFLASFGSLFSQIKMMPSFGTDSTFDVVTWNIENFPKNGQVSIDSIAEIIDVIDADIIAFQEVSDTTAFKEMLSNLPQYEHFLVEQYYTSLAYIYKTGVVEINDFYEIYTSSQYWSAFPRSPLVFDLNYQNQRFFIINNHLKCCGNGIIDYGNDDDEETRRYYAINFLRTYIDSYLSNKNVIVLGDLNDEITDEIVNNVFKSFINYPESFLFADMEIAESASTEWSYPSWPSHLDHILITNELFDDFQNPVSDIKTQKVDEYLLNAWSEYQQNISDHRPLALKLKINDNSGIGLEIDNSGFYAFPNPADIASEFTFDCITVKSQIEIFTCSGQLLDVIYLNAGQSSATWNCSKLESGVYLAKLKREGMIELYSKIIVH